MDKYGQQAKEMWSRWQAQSFSRKAAWLGSCTLCLGFAGLLWWVSQPDYRVLYAGLSAEEAGAITTKLQTKGVSFKLASGGTTILVPADQAMQVHIDLSTEGVPGSSKIGKGLDLFDQPMLGATPFNQHVNFMRAQQSELARTIMQIDPIIYTRVHIVRPEPSPFVREQKPTTASVMVKLRPGATLNRNTISGIGALVSGSIEGLTKENVRIIDASGRLLSDNHDTETGMGSFIEQRKEVEQYLASEAERVLTHVLGTGRAIVRVTAELNTKQMHEKKEIINADGRVPRTEKITLNKTISNGGGGKGGAVGTSSNTGKPVSGGSGGSGSTTNQETQQSDYDYPRTTQEWQNKQGSIDRLTIAAFVDISGVNEEQALTVADIQEIIKKAVGFKTDRDEIQVTQVRVPTVTSESFEEEWAGHLRLQTILTAVRNGSIALGVLCAGVMAWVMVRRRAKTAPAAAATDAAPEKLQRITEELDRNPEMLAKILSRWIERSEASDRAAA